MTPKLVICLIFILGTFDLLRLFGFDITGFTFGFSIVESTIYDAEDRFIRPKHCCDEMNKLHRSTLSSDCSTHEWKRKDASRIPYTHEENVDSLDRVNTLIVTFLNCFNITEKYDDSKYVTILNI